MPATGGNPGKASPSRTIRKPEDLSNRQERNPMEKGSGRIFLPEPFFVLNIKQKERA